MFKKTNIYLLALLISLSLLPLNSIAAENTQTAISSVQKPNEVPVEVKALLLRLDQINSMDKSGLNTTEKKTLRTEVRGIKSKLKATGNGGIYLSGGAVIIIIILLIILL
ncbi:MAG: hypothetical protein PSX81_05540 [bacterium]|nr:hypothetical protein [bacterium]